MMHDVVASRERTIKEMMGTVGMAVKEVEMKTEYRVMQEVDVTEPGESLVFVTQMIEGIRKMCHEIHLVRLFHNVDF